MKSYKMSWKVIKIHEKLVKVLWIHVKSQEMSRDVKKRHEESLKVIKSHQKSSSHLKRGKVPWKVVNSMKSGKVHEKW